MGTLRTQNFKSSKKCSNWNILEPRQVAHQNTQNNETKLFAHSEFKISKVPKGVPKSVPIGTSEVFVQI